MSQDEQALKQAAAESAAARITDGMIVGLGSGTTAALAVDVIGRRVREGLRISGIPTSERTEAQARSLGIPLTTLTDVTRIDMTIDGADEVSEGALNLIKGLGGALLREKIVASVTERLVIVADDRKLVSRLATRSPVPVEVTPFGWEATARKLSAMGARPVLRRSGDGKPFISDGGHNILDCGFDPVESPETLARELDHVVGLVEHGLFIGMATEVHLAGPGGVRILHKGSPR
jgi:ribose 5-phosphate isomerase A